MKGNSSGFAGDLTLWTCPEKFYVSSEDFPGRLLVIDRITHVISAEPNRHQIPALVSRRPISGVLGILNLLSGPHLVVVSKKKRVGSLTSDNHIIWRLEEVSILPYSRSDHHLRLDQRETNQEHLKLVEDLFKTPHFYFSNTLDLSNTQQRLDGLYENDVKGHKGPLSSASRTFTWNRHMLCNGGLLQNADFHPWCIVLIHGAVLIHECSINGKLFRWTLLSRRSNKRSGTRFYRRGCDSDGNVANFVETEQLVEHKETLTSFVQIRGSIPLFWSQIPTLAYMPVPKLRDNNDHEQAFNRHFERLVHSYGQQVAVNLINHTKREGLLERKFRYLHEMSQFRSHIDYEAFDFHAECKQLRWDRLHFLVGKLLDRLNKFGCFVQSRGVVSRLQTGVVRTNCMDCLDRTNVVQSLFAAENLTQVLRTVNIMPEGDVVTAHADFNKLFRNAWADHANIIALQYAGSEALKTDFTRTGKRTLSGMLTDLRVAVSRYVKNNFFDGHRQDSIDIVLGNCPVEVLIGASDLVGHKWTFYLPLILLAIISLLFLTILLLSEFVPETVLFLICLMSTTILLVLVIMRHSHVYVDHPKLTMLEQDTVTKQ